MGQSLSKEDTAKYDTLQNMAAKEGPENVEKYIKQKMDTWKVEIVKIALTGETAVGKSAFINRIRDVGPSHPNFAKTGSGNTTKKPTMYDNPKNPNIQFWDLPGVATLDFKMEAYQSEMDLSKYDYFMIFFDKVLKESDLWLAQKLNTMSKPFSLVRSKIDVDIENAIHDGKSKDIILPEIRTEIEEALQKATDLKSYCRIFLVSSRNPALGDMPELLSHMEKYLPSSKYEAVLFSLPSLTEHFIERTYSMLQNRIFYVSILASLASIVPLIGKTKSLSRLTDELGHYISCFNLSLEKSESFRSHFAGHLSNGDLKGCVEIKLSTIRTETTKFDISRDIKKYIAKVGLNPVSIESNTQLLKWFLDLFKKEALSVVNKRRTDLEI